MTLVKRAGAAGVSLSAGLLGLATHTPPAEAVGNGSMNVWQAGFSYNCDVHSSSVDSPCYNPDTQQVELGGFWGWAEFDQSGAVHTGDVSAAGCGHLLSSQYPGAHPRGGAGSSRISITHWTIDSVTGDFVITDGTETDSVAGQPPVTYSISNEYFDTGIPATPGHYSTQTLFGFTVPAAAIQIQVSFKAAR